MNNLTENIPTFKELEKEILTYGYNICIAITKNILEAYDRKLLAERDRKIYRHKGYRTNHIRCVYGDVSYKRAIYECIDDTGKKVTLYLLDDNLSMNLIGRLSQNSVEAMIETSAKMSFRKAEKTLNQTCRVNISHQGIWNTLQKFGERLEHEEAEMAEKLAEDRPQTGKEVPVLFEEADGIHLFLQGKYRPKHARGKEIKVSTAYEGMRKDRNGRNELVGKVMTAGYENSKDFHRIREAMIRSKYNTDEIKHRFINGDGASWVKRPYDNDTVFQLDRFHVLKKIVECIEDADVRRSLKSLYHEGKAQTMLDILAAYADSIGPDDPTGKLEEKARGLYKYLMNNKKGITAFQDARPNLPAPPEGIIYGSMGIQENQNCSVITLRMKHHKGSWSIPGANHMAKILTRFENKTIYSDLERYTGTLNEELQVIVNDILSAGSIPKLVAKGKSVGSAIQGHWAMADAKVTSGGKAMLRAFGFRTFSELKYT